jgi:hypothetical protein
VLSQNLSDNMQMWGFEGDFTVFSDSSLGFGLELSPLDSSCWDDSRSESLSERTRHFLNGLPPGISAQFVLDIGAGNEPTLSQHRNLAKETNGIATELALTRVARYQLLEGDRLLPKYGLRLFVRRLVTQARANKRNRFGGQKLFQPLSEARLDEELSQTEKLRSEIIASLRGLEVEAAPISCQEIATLFYDQWNPARPISIPNFSFEDCRSDLLFTDISIDVRGFSLGGVHHRVLSLKRLPEHTFAAMAAKLAELPFGSRTFLTIGTLDQETELSKLQIQRRLAFAMARGKAGVSDIESESKFQDLESLLEHMIAQGEKVFRMSLNILLRSTSEEDLDRGVSESLTALRGLSGAEAMEESIAAFDVFSELSIPNSRASERAKWIETSNLANFLPLYAAWRGHTKPSILLRSRLGSLIGFDPFSKDLPNFNHIVTGGSGAGKSFLTNLLLLQMLKES